MIGSELLRGDKVRLAALSKPDAGTIASWYDDGEFLRMYDGRLAMPRTEEQIAGIIAKGSENDNQCMFGIRRIAGNVLVGTANLDEIVWRNRAAWLQIALGPQYWGKGYGTEALGLLLRFAFTEANLHKVQLTVFDYNARALALYARYGFVREGVMRESTWRDGVYHNMVLMGLLESEWAEGQEASAPTEEA